MPNKDILEECEIDCLTGELIACPLTQEKKDKCEKRMEYLRSVMEENKSENL